MNVFVSKSENGYQLQQVVTEQTSLIQFLTEQGDNLDGRTVSVMKENGNELILGRRDEENNPLEDITLEEGAIIGITQMVYKSGK